MVTIFWKLWLMATIWNIISFFGIFDLQFWKSPFLQFKEWIVNMVTIFWKLWLIATIWYIISFFGTFDLQFRKSPFYPFKTWILIQSQINYVYSSIYNFTFGRHMIMVHILYAYRYYHSWNTIIILFRF